jgi:hypothetical protein
MVRVPNVTLRDDDGQNRMHHFWRLLRHNRITVALLSVIFLLVAFSIWNTLGPQHDARVEAIRRQGYPVTLAELQDWYKSVPDAQNAALVYTQAFGLRAFADSSKLNDLSDSKKWLPQRGQMLKADKKAELTELLATNQPALELLHSAVALSGSRYPIDFKDGFNTLLPHLGLIKKAVILLMAEALVDASNGDTEKALEDLRAAARVADSVSEEPLVISQLVRIACWSIITSCLERVVNLTALTDEQLASLRKMLGDAEKPQAQARALAGERAMGLAMFTDRKQQEALFSLQQHGIRRMAFIGVLKTTGLLQKDKSFYLGVMATNIGAAELPFPQRMNLGQQADPATLSPPNRFCIISSMILPSLSKVSTKDAEHAARIRVAETGLAVERFRRRHGNDLPADLEEIVPSFLAAVPADPYDGHALRFKKLPRGYVVYSVGSDGRDDGGAEYDSQNPTAKHDLTFIVEH